MDTTDILSDELLEVRSDIVFQDIFSEVNKQLLTLLLSQLLRKPYNEVDGKYEVKNIRLARISLKEKQKYCDYIIRMDNNYYIIELNNHYRGVFTRNSTYAFSVINEAYGTNEKRYYNENIKTTLFNLNWHEYKRDKIKDKSLAHLYPRTYEENDYLLKMVNINLDYYVDKNYNEVDEYEKLFKLFTIKSLKELKELTKNDIHLHEYAKIMESLMRKKGYKEMVLSDLMEERLRQDEIRTCMNMAYNDGTIEGQKIGFEKSQHETVINMVKDNIPVKTIAKYVNLTLDEVKKIIKEMKNNSVSTN